MPRKEVFEQSEIVLNIYFLSNFATGQTTVDSLAVED